MKIKRFNHYARFSFALLVASYLLISCVMPSNNIVSSFVNASVVSNGDVAGEPTNLNVLLSSTATNRRLELDWVNFGHQIPAGGHMEVELGGSFQRNGMDNTLPFVPVNSNATLVLGTGHPQNPIVTAAGVGVQHGNYRIEDNQYKIIKVIPNGGFKKNGLENLRAALLGVKNIHIRPDATIKQGPFRNGPAGSTGYVTIRIFDRNENIVESGQGAVLFVAPEQAAPYVGLCNYGTTTLDQTSPTTISTKLVESLNYQHVGPSTAFMEDASISNISSGTPLAMQFVLIDALSAQPDSFEPMKGIAGVGYLLDKDNSSNARLMQDTNGNGVLEEGDKQLGVITIRGPTRSKLIPSARLTTSGDGVSGQNGSILVVKAAVGYKFGVYDIKVSLNDGAKAVSSIIVEDR